MTKEVIVSISGVQQGENVSEDPIEVYTTGTYYYKNNKHYVLFEEMLEGSNDITKSTLIFADKNASLKRTGAAIVQMVFDKDNKTVSNYTTPYGDMVIGISTNGLQLSELEDKISLSIDYALDINYQFLANCKLNVNITPIGAPVKLQ